MAGSGAGGGGAENDQVTFRTLHNSQVNEKERAGRPFCKDTYSLFFSLTLAPFLRSSSATCFRLGCKEATAQCCNTNKSQFKKSRLVFKRGLLNETAAESYLEHCNLRMYHGIMTHFSLRRWSIFPLNTLGVQTK